MLAPMEGVTDNAFRTLCYRNGADLTFTEMARVDNLSRLKRGELEKITITNKTPTQIQIAGAKISEYEKFLRGCDILPPVNGVGFLCVMQSLHQAKDVFYRFSVQREPPPFEVLHSLPERDFPSVRG